MTREYTEKEREQRKKARNKYVKNMIICKNVALNRKTDVDILEYLENLDDTFSGYIHKLIRADMQVKTYQPKHKKKDLQ